MNTLITKPIQVAAIVILGLSAASCGLKAKPVSALREPLVGSALVQVYPLSELAFKDEADKLVAGAKFEDIQIFFWKEGFTPDDVDSVLGISEESEGLTDKEFMLSVRQSELVKSFTDKGLEEPGSIEERIQQSQKTIEKQSQLSEKNQKGIEQEESKPEDQRDQKKLDKLKSDLKKNLAAIEKARKSVEADEAAIKDAGLKPAWEELKGIKARKDQMPAALDNVAKRLEAASDITNAPKRVNFYLQGDGSFQGEMIGWDLKDGRGGVTYTTADHTLVGISYNEVGGVIQWEVLSKGLTYRFKMSRYRDSGEKKAIDGRLYYKGKVLVFDAEGNEVQAGIVKMIDRPAKAKTEDGEPTGPTE